MCIYVSSHRKRLDRQSWAWGRPSGNSACLVPSQAGTPLQNTFDIASSCREGQTRGAAQWGDLKQIRCEVVPFRHQEPDPIEYRPVVSGSVTVLVCLALLPIAERVVEQLAFLLVQRLSTAD